MAYSASAARQFRQNIRSGNGNSNFHSVGSPSLTESPSNGVVKAKHKYGRTRMLIRWSEYD